MSIHRAVGKVLRKWRSQAKPKTVAWEIPFSGRFHIDVVGRTDGGGDRAAGHPFERDPEIGSGLDIQLLVGEKPLEAKGSIASVKRIEWKSSVPLALVEVKMLDLSAEAREVLEGFLHRELTRRPIG